MGALEAIMWFFGGVFVYRLLTKILNYGYMVNMYREMLFSSLSLLRMADDNFVRANKVVREASEKSGKDLKEINLENETNIAILRTWRTLVIATLKKMTPNHFSSLAEFDNWQQAMKLLENKGRKNVAD